MITVGYFKDRKGFWHTVHEMPYPPPHIWRFAERAPRDFGFKEDIPEPVITKTVEFLLDTYRTDEGICRALYEEK